MNDKKDIIVVTGKVQANQIFDEMKSREVDRLNFNFKGTMQFLIDVRDKLNHPEKMVRDLKGLQNLQKLIDEYINISTNLALTMPETCHFEGNEQLVKRNADYNMKATKSLEKSLKAIKRRIKIIKTKGTEVPEREFNNIKVARAFCLWELFNAGKLENYYQIRPDGYYRFRRKIFEDYIRSKFNLSKRESSATIYAQAIQFINSKRYEFYTKQSPEYSKDYNYGLKLFNTMQ